jgi:hypothetical protein
VVAPNPQVHVDDVVVGDGEAAESIGDVEGSGLVGRGVVPDDANRVVDLRDAERAGGVVAPELRVSARLVAPAFLADRDVVDRLARAERDVAVRAAEGAGEVERDPLADEERPVRLDADADVGGRERVRLRGGGRRPEERDRREREEAAAEEAQVVNCTDGASRVTPSVSK